MKIVSKFIINREDTEFLYVEKFRTHKKSDDMKYVVYSSHHNIHSYSDHIFHSVHSLDEKMSIENFAKKAADGLVTELYDKKKQAGYHMLTEIYDKVSNDKDKHNPNLKGVKDNLLKGLKIYNEFLLEQDNISIPYEDNYLLLENDKTLANERLKVKNISNLAHYVDSKYRNNIDNIPVKELVRIKKSA